MREEEEKRRRRGKEPGGEGVNLRKTAAARRKLNYLNTAFSERHLPIVRKKIRGYHDDQGAALITTATTDFFAHGCFHDVHFWVPLGRFNAW